MLGRVIEYGEEGIEWMGDPRHQVKLEEYFGMTEHTKILGRNGYDVEGKDVEEEHHGDLTKEEVRNFRMLAARLNYMAQDNMWIQFAAKEICRNMSQPCVRDFEKVKQLVRFLKGVGNVKTLYKWQTEEDAQNITVLVDSDWAGCRTTRKSTSGGVIKLGAHVLTSWSKTQATVATSSGEAELIAIHD